ncbi:MAG TPA: DUF3857 domain-containing protein [Candidatus Acidoferrum sp.]|nr:DUF3857 domain-containing protein [Candidatus Acidoferrum sp.]
MLLASFGVSSTHSQQPTPEAAKPAQKAPEASVKPPELPAQIELLETHVRFEANGDSRKEVHTRVRIHNELGARQFARLSFDYNRSFQQIDFPLVRITHAGGGTVDILPSAISDQPNPAVRNAPAYQDVRVKSLRILGLAPSDLLEYRVVTTTSRHPLAPDFWLDHTFDRSGITAQEIFELDLPSSRKADLRINPATPATSTDSGNAGRTIYRWERALTNAKVQDSSKDLSSAAPDVAVSTYSWNQLSIRLDERLTFEEKTLKEIGTYEEHHDLAATRDATPTIAAQAHRLTSGMPTESAKARAIYDFVSQKIATIDLPLGATGFATRPADAVLSSGYATAEDKFVLLAALNSAEKLNAQAALAGSCDAKGLARPSVFKRLLISGSEGKAKVWLDPSLEVAPFGVIPPNSGPCVFVLNRFFFVMDSHPREWLPLQVHLPFASTQHVNIDATITKDGGLTAKVRYALRGENELLLRIAFHQAPKGKWTEVAQLLALSDGFRGNIAKVTASDPYATKQPFSVEYEITQPKFVDWSKKPVRIPALLPQLGLPDPPVKSTSAIDLGTPLDVQTHLTLHLPAGTTVRTPTGTSVVRDYATFASRYQSSAATVTASRHLNFLSREIPYDRAADYNAFTHAVQSDEAQEFLLDRPATPPSKPTPPPGTPISALALQPRLRERHVDPIQRVG